MKVLIVSGSFYPIIAPRAFRTTELAKEFAREGHDVIVLIPETNFDYSEFLKEYPLIKFLYYKREILVFKNKLQWKLGRIFETLFCYPSVLSIRRIAKALKNYGKFDLTISIAAPHSNHWATDRIIRHNPSFTRNWIADCGDPFMLLLNDRKMFYFKWIEKSWCRRCDYISVPFEGAVNAYYPEFRKKIRIIPQSFDMSAIKLADYVENDIITFGYCGRFLINKLDPRPIMDFLIKKNINFRFVVYTTQKELFTDYIDKLKDKLILHGFLPREEVIYEMSKMDFLLFLPYNKYQRSSKLIDYSLTKRPILSIDSNNIDEEELMQFLNRDYSKQIIIDDIDRYDIKNVAQQFLNLCK